MARPRSNRVMTRGPAGEFIWTDGPPTKRKLQQMLGRISECLRESRLRDAQHEAMKLYQALYSMGLLPELSE